MLSNACDFQEFDGGRGRCDGPPSGRVMRFELSMGSMNFMDSMNSIDSTMATKDSMDSMDSIDSLELIGHRSHGLQWAP